MDKTSFKLMLTILLVLVLVLSSTYLTRHAITMPGVLTIYKVFSHVCGFFHTASLVVIHVRMANFTVLNL